MPDATALDQATTMIEKAWAVTIEALESITVSRPTDPGLPIRPAINPDFPFTHYLGAEIVVRDGKAFIADDGQEDYLPPSVSDALSWA
ncbi:hypothetical protein [Streptomyces sp. NPDC020330]|uniref:hypothetical protein n=1 Tax=unclassified Streptomyces TaxID=2593676 RepID=UPI003787D6B4